MPRFAANLSFLFTEVPFLERFAEAAHAGFHGVECAFPYDGPATEIAAQLQRHRLEMVLFNTPPGDFAAGERGTASLPGREHEFAASFVAALRYAKVLSCRRLHVMAGFLAKDADAERRARQRRTLVHNLRFACDEARGQGVTVLIEPLNPRDMPGYLYSTQEEAHSIREEVGAPNLKVQMDLYHAQIVEGDLTENIRRWLPQVGHIQIAGVPGRHEPDIGEINYSWIFRLLDELKYDGWIGCEYKPQQNTAAGLTWLYRLLDRRPVGMAGVAGDDD
jgi:hydroxypyruvate isomerase